MADLISTATYKTMTGITSTNQDTRIAPLITSVSQLVKTYCNNTFVDFVSSAKTETFNVDYNEHFVQLTETPLIAINSVSEREKPTDTYTNLTNNTDYYADSVTDTIFRVDSGGNEKQFKSGKGAVKVVYTAGYSTLPQDLELAVMDLVTYYLKDERKQRQTIAGASLNNQTSTSQRDNVGFPDHIKRVLDLYKNF
jgi:hypothetical protein